MVFSVLIVVWSMRKGVGLGEGTAIIFDAGRDGDLINRISLVIFRFTHGRFRNRDGWLARVGAAAHSLFERIVELHTLFCFSICDINFIFDRLADHTLLQTHTHVDQVFHFFDLGPGEGY